MTRAALAERASKLRAEGKVYREIAESLGISRSYAAELITDPGGEIVRARKASYGGVCVDCGAPTRSDGTSRASERCTACASQQKFWTREAVVAAIQRFAAVHGRPPTADEWLHADHVNGYPNRGSVYRGSPTSTSPFAKWRDALAAAGFPGRHTGRRTDKEVHTMSNDRTGYVVLHETETGWEVVAESDEGTQIGALNAALNGHQPEGRWVAIPGRYWRPRELRSRTIFDWAEENQPA